MSLKISVLSGTLEAMNQLLDKLNLALPALAMIAIGFLTGVIMRRIWAEWQLNSMHYQVSAPHHKKLEK